MSATVQCVYLHGFASGPNSTKARFFAQQLRQRDVTVHVPNLNGQAFADLTISSQLALVDELIAAQGVESGEYILFGSSLGGLLSVLLAQRNPAIKALILLAPGFGLSRRWIELLGADQLERWRQVGTMEVFHHAANCKMPLKYAFIEDAQKFQTDDLQIAVPALVMHGVHDDVVPIEESVRFAKLNPANVELHEMDSDHGLTDVLPQMWELANEFLQRHGFLPASERTPPGNKNQYV